MAKNRYASRGLVSDQRRSAPVERIILGLPDLAIQGLVSARPLVIEVAWTGNPVCPHCQSTKLRIKDSFWRFIKSIRLHDRPSTLKIYCHKYRCLECGKYFNTRLPGVKRWSRTTEVLKQSIFSVYNKGHSNKDIAEDNGIGVATVERFYHQMIVHKNSHFQNRPCPRILGIDEHRFTKKQGFVTTFCDLKRQRIFDIALGKDVSKLHEYLCNLKGRERVRVVCIDMNSGYRNLVKQYFPNAVIVSDRFHVIRLVNHHLTSVCKSIDEEHIAHGRGRLMRLLMTRKDRLTGEQCKRLQEYFSSHPAIQAVYDFCHKLNDLLRIKRKNRHDCTKYIPAFLQCVKQLQQSPFKAMRTLGTTLSHWKEEVVRMFRFTKNNGITEGFHRKMKLIQRRAYGFRNFENYRLRVRVLCG